jgi:signal transduction histidine kinase
LANFGLAVVLVDYGSLPFQFVWLSLALLYGFRLWRTRTTIITFAVVLLTGLMLAWLVHHETRTFDELVEVPVIGCMFLTLVWHAERRREGLRSTERLAEQQREFVRDASHQLKTPIAGARALASMIQSGSDRLQQDVADLIGELDRLGLISERLLVLAAAHSNDMVRAPVEVEDLVTAALARWSRRATRAWWVKPDSVASILGDRRQLEDALDAILENAVRATTPEQAIGIQTRQDGRSVVIEVIDNGRGMSLEHTRRAFDRFWSSAVGASGERGTGLGLAIVKAVAEAHGGAVELSSVLQGGTTVRLVLPGVSERAAPAPRLARVMSRDQALLPHE